MLTRVLCFLAVEALMLFGMTVALLAPVIPLFLLLQLAERLI